MLILKLKLFKVKYFLKFMVIRKKRKIYYAWIKFHKMAKMTSLAIMLNCK